MLERQELEAVFLAHLVSIERMAAAVCRRYSLTDDEVDDFASWTTEKLLENDYAVLRKFRGEAKLTTYLHVVIVQLFRDYHVRERGRWRPSAEAHRRGKVAERLEALIYRDGYRLDQAGEILRSQGLTTQSDAELAQTLKEIPPHAPPRPEKVDPQVLESAASGDAADAPLEEREAWERQQSLRAALHAAIERLEPQDRVILRLRMFEGYTVLAISEELELEHKPLFRRLQRIFAELRTSLESAGFTRSDVMELLQRWQP